MIVYSMFTYLLHKLTSLTPITVAIKRSCAAISKQVDFEAGYIAFTTPF